MTVLPFERRTAPAAAGPSDLTREQVATLLAPINPSRVQNLRGQSHLEAWDVRRWLNRVFGFGGWADETLELACVAQVEINPGRWTVIYRAQVRLTVKTTDGRLLTTYDDAAMGDSRNQPALGDAHDQAMKTALSQALKRCAHNLGDAFGLSLYNDGSRQAVGLWSAAHPAPKDDDAPAVPDDAPVKPEPAPAADQPAAVEQDTPTAQVRRGRRAEPGPWEQQPAPAQQGGPSRDFLAEARKASSRQQFDAVRAAAVAEGAPEHYLADLDGIAAQREQDAQQGKQPAKKAAARRPAAKKAPAKKVAASKQAPPPASGRPEHEVAVADVLSVGQSLGLTREQVEEIVRAETGSTLAEADTEQLVAVVADLRAATTEVAA
ncbi:MULTISPECIES: Rad52/Rad22 family DNA repair protein [unclassified Streptomyces]|uniref:Rad52/Rad22 family DNA repair protein n=1 Tax=unclassified Streptomyces TaxID=2593676 RepID=UPI0037F59217